ncbi:RidA family protein [Spirosoma agri]|uniref:RidA family protein n=1 Tax=Spirosoma agri TaxID=1987381 RepID=A0A6M0IJC8_9BACT|nr:RidA family protein [Spirosoma agri]NEU68406.1 RidA family protein [Spirosoma agri]
MRFFLTVLPVLLIASFAQAQTSSTYPTGYLYRVETGVGNRQVYISNQRPFNANGELVGAGDLTAQTQQVFENLKTALGAVGLTLRDVKQVTYHVKGQDAQVNSALTQEVTSASAAYFTQGMPGIAEVKSIPQIVQDKVLVEIEVIAEK